MANHKQVAFAEITEIKVGSSVLESYESRDYCGSREKVSDLCLF